MCKVSLSVRSPAGETRRVTLNHSIKKQRTVCDLKKIALLQFAKKEYNKAEIRLVFGGKPLDDDSASLSEYGLTPSSVVQMVMKVNGG